MTRRDLLALPLFSPLMAETVETVHYKNDPPFFAYTGLIESGHDEYPRDPAMPAYPPRKDGRFADITGTVLDSEQLSKGIPYWLARLDPATGIDIYGNQGLAVGDIDGDGLDEIYVCQPAGLPNRLFRWRNEKLIEVAAGVDLLDDSASALFLDLRNLGRQDLVVLRGSGPVLFLNDGQGRFTLAPDAFRFVSPPQGAFTGMAAADYDRDGRLDLYLCTYSFFQSEAQFRYPVPYFDAQKISLPEPFTKLSKVSRRAGSEPVPGQSPSLPALPWPTTSPDYTTPGCKIRFPCPCPRRAQACSSLPRNPLCPTSPRIRSSGAIFLNIAPPSNSRLPYCLMPTATPSRSMRRRPTPNKWRSTSSELISATPSPILAANSPNRAAITLSSVPRSFGAAIRSRPCRTSKQIFVSNRAIFALWF